MSDTQKLLLSAVAVAVAAFSGPIWSWAKAAMNRPSPAVRPSSGSGSFGSAIESLAAVRGRLASTGCLDDQATAAIETLTHSLVRGSDK